MPTLATKNGLDALIKELENSGVRALTASWAGWFESAVLQLEEDDRFDAHFTDALAGTLEELDAAIRDGIALEQTARELVSVYHRHGQAESVEARWRRRIAELGSVQLETGLWLDLTAALDAARTGQRASVAAWLDEMRTMFEETWASYLASDILPSEVTAESRLGHRLLGEGIQAWMAAFAKFREGLTGRLDRTGILAQAEAGQRLLVGLQAIEAENKTCVDHFAAAWAN